MYPEIGGIKLKNRFVKPMDNEYLHFKYFLSY